MSMGCLEATGTTCILALQGLLFFYFFFPGFICKTLSGAGKDNFRNASLSCVINLCVCVGFCTFMGKKKITLKNWEKVQSGC